jgi:hypothetical protein
MGRKEMIQEIGREGGGGPEGKKLFGKHVSRWNYNIKMNLKQDGMAWNGLSWFKIGISE